VSADANIAHLPDVDSHIISFTSESFEQASLELGFVTIR
jgi:hypothetical protein